MRLGFIGTGKIASSVIIGICNSNIKYKQIIISPRNKKIALSLKKKFKKIIISKTNQEIVDKSDWVFLSVTPSVGEKIIKDLKFRQIKKSLVSFPQ
jgi:pyrroline-5-carboxylate reductase